MPVRPSRCFGLVFLCVLFGGVSCGASSLGSFFFCCVCCVRCGCGGFVGRGGCSFGSACFGRAVLLCRVALAVGSCVFCPSWLLVLPVLWCGGRLPWFSFFGGAVAFGGCFVFGGAVLLCAAVACCVVVVAAGWFSFGLVWSCVAVSFGVVRGVAGGFVAGLAVACGCWGSSFVAGLASCRAFRLRLLCCLVCAVGFCLPLFFCARYKNCRAFVSL